MSFAGLGLSITLAGAANTRADLVKAAIEAVFIKLPIHRAGKNTELGKKVN